jgi:MFS transporter, SP family, general alpha glucoside:H+ symporter
MFMPKENSDSVDEVVLITVTPKPSSAHQESSTAEFNVSDGGDIRHSPSNIYAGAVNSILWLPRASTSSSGTGARVQRGLTAEKEMSLLDCCKKYPKAISWSILLFLTVVMEAYDKSLISGFIAFPAFRRQYGEPRLQLTKYPEAQDYEISPLWQMGLQNAAVACEIIGLLAHGYLTYIIGYRRMMMIALAWLSLAILPAFFAPTIGVMVTAQALCGEFLA